MTSGKIWTADEVKLNITKSDAWAARAIYVIGQKYDDVMSTMGASNRLKNDRLFFVDFFGFFKNYGYFTKRQLEIGRAKMRSEHLDYLVKLANEGN